MAVEIDSLEVRLQATMNNVDSSVDKIVRDLNSLNTSVKGTSKGVANLSKSIQNLARVSPANLEPMSRGLTSVSTAMEMLSRDNRADAVATTLSSISSSIRKFGSKANTNALSKLPSIANNINKFNETITTVDSSKTEGLTAIASAITKFGYKSTDKAIKNLPSLANGLNQMITTLSKAPAVSSGTISLMNSMATIASSGQKVGSASNSINKAFKALTPTTHKLGLRMFNIASIMGTLYANLFLVKRVVSTIWSITENAMNYVETYNYFTVAMQKTASEYANYMSDYGEEGAERWYDAFTGKLTELTEKMSGYDIGESGQLYVTSNAGLGLDPNEIMNFQAKLVQITNSVGMLGSASTDTASAFSKLAYDISSLTNTDVDQVMSNLTSGLTGSAKALYKYGIDITNTTLQQLALDLGIQKSVTEMTQMEKMQLRVIQVLKASRSSWADQINTINTSANQYRILKQQINNVGITMGSLLLPVVQNVLPYINGMTIAVNRLLQSLGQQLYGGDWWAELLDGISGYSSEDTFDWLEDSADEATDSIKALKKQLQGFDELNVLSSDTSSSASSIAGAIDLSEYIKQAADDYETVWNRAYEKMQNRAEELADILTDALAPVKKLFSDLLSGDWEASGEDITNIATNVLDTASRVIEEVEWDEVGSAVVTFLSNIDWVKIIKSAGNFVGTILNACAELLGGMWDANPLATAIVGALAVAKFSGLTEVMAAAISNSAPTSVTLGKAIAIVATFTISFEGGKKLGEMLFPEDSDIYQAFQLYSSTDDSLATSTSALFDRIFGGKFMEDWVDFPEYLWQKLKSAWGMDEDNFIGWFIKNYILKSPGTLAMQGLADFTVTLEKWIGTGDVGGIIDDLAEQWDKKWYQMNYAVVVVGSTLVTLKTHFDECLFNPIATFFNDVKTEIKEVREAFAYLSSSATIPFRITMATNIVTFISNIKKQISDAWSNFTIKVAIKKGTDILNLITYIKNLIKGYWDSFSQSLSIKTPNYTTLANQIVSLKNIIQNVWANKTITIGVNFSSIKNAWNNLVNEINPKLRITIDTSTAVGRSLWKLFGTNVIRLGNLPTFMNGGYTPTTSGSLFVAGENGIPELMGTIGGRSAVASGAEITGIRDSIEKHMETESRLLNLLIQVVEEKDTSISSDDLFKSVRKSANNYKKATGNSAFNY